MRRTPVAAWIGGAFVAAALAACSSPSSPVAAGSTTPAGTSGSGSPVASPSASPTRTLPADASPLSGRAGGAGKRVLVVKFDNTTFAQPHAGLKDADIVYVEEVEFGLTRLAAVFSTTLPKVLGPIRSARISDIDLLKQFGKPAFAYSGAQHKMRPILGAASIYDVSGDKGGTGYFRDSGRRGPYNFMGHAAELLGRAPDASKAASVGFVFALDTPAGGRSGRSVTANYPDSQAKFVWNPGRSSYDVFLNKRPARAAEGGTQHATTVVIQYVKQYDSGFGDKYGGHTPKEETIGTGTGWVLRDGKAWAVTWSRPDGVGGTTYTDAAGNVVAFAPGQVWVALVNRTHKVALA